MANDALIEIVRIDMDRLRGQLFMLLEATGMPKNQQAAIKGCIRNITYSTQGELEADLRGEESHEGDRQARVG